MKRILVLFGLICTVVTMTAQVGVEAKIDSIQMLIGQQVHVTVTATTPSNAKVVFPSFKSRDTLVAGVEVLNISKEQKEELEQGQQQISRVYTLTSFDGKLYYLPPFQVKVDGKMYQSKSLALKVLEVEVDTTNLNQYYGPKDVQNNPFLWSDWSTAFWLSVLILLLMAVAYYLYLRLRDNKPIIKSFKIVKKLLPHQKAMKEIEQMEMTSSEIIERLTQDGDQKSLDELRELFTTADLVKFAKYSTLINENDKNLVSAIEFINQTKQELQVVEEEKPQLSEADQRSLKTRRILKWTIGSIIVVSVVLIGYVIYRLMILTEFI